MNNKKRIVKIDNIAGACLGFAFALVILSPLKAEAGLILQDTESGASQVLAFSPIGQVFTAEDELIQSIGFFIHDFNRPHAPTDHNLQVNLYSGDSGSSSAFIGQSIVNDIPDDQN